MMRASIVVVKDGMVLLVHRFKDGLEFYVIPGGGSEKGETPEQSALREAKEETGLDVVLERKLWEFTNPKDNRLNVYFLVREFTGELCLGGPEKEKNTESNHYILEWHNLDKITSLNIVPETAKNNILREFCG